MKNEVKVMLDEKTRRTLVVEHGQLAKQADGACVAKIGETIVLATVVYNPTDKENASFLPLTVDYRERTYAAGKIPGGFFKREGRPSEREILTSRLIDRSIRPLFPENWHKETNVNVIVMSHDGANDPNILAVAAAGCALRLSTIPMSDDLASVRVGKIDGEFVVNPTLEEQTLSAIDIVVSGTQDGVVMVEAGAREVGEDEILAAIAFARGVIKKILKETAAAIPAGKKIDLPKADETTETVRSSVASLLSASDIKSIVLIKEKKERDTKWWDKKKEITEKVAAEIPESAKKTASVLEDMFYAAVRELIIKENIRADGRKPDEVRPIECYPHYFERQHGSALFQRGQTQAFAAVTLGTPRDKQIMDVLEGEYKERFLFHYNFPGFATGEAKPERGVSRREQGHGALAKRALYPVVPTDEEFPYTIRIVSDILESNGSSSMASVCGGSLALFDAGVPIKRAVAGVAMGLVKEDSKYVILTDIMGMEDHIGDMDFKVAGTRQGITALQMDLKITNIDASTMKDALERAQKARFFILDLMDKAISSPRPELSEYAPKMEIVQISPSKIGALIGPGGKNIKKIQEETKANISVEDDGKVYISAIDSAALELARQMVEFYTADAEMGKTYKGKVTRTLKIGAFVEIMPGKEGLVHVSQLSRDRMARVTDYVQEGDELIVTVSELDEKGRINLSLQGNNNKLRK
ncbi:MAG: polyribonucleotide nucleotidyltransferase [Endomicrobiia bacterium]|nr:polyribonucleotide nucleotidyltransferase [Endomicrobiia bacterium]